MHFPWKKVRSTRLSRLVNDHLHNSQKRRDGSSLVVETGFPTSLVDLFIKNREKLKKPSRKKRQSFPLTPVTDGPAIAASPAYSVSPPPAPAPSPASPGSPVPSLHCPPDSKSSLLLPSVDVDVDVDGILVSGFGKSDFLVLLKMVLVVCFVVGCKRLTVGITVSAVLLFFLEHVGRHACRSLKTFSGAQGLLLLRSTVQRICVLLKFHEVKSDENHDENLMQEVQQEIQSTETNACSVADGEEIRSEMEEEGIEKEGTNCEVVELKRAKSRRAKLRSKMKKFFSNKLRRSRKEHDPQRLEIEEGSIFLCDEQEAFHECSNEGVSEEEDNTIAVCAFSGLPTDIRQEIKAGVRWKYLFLYVIVLAGLIGGRAFAILLTLSSCLLFKLRETLPRYYMKLPVIRHFSN